MIKVGDRVKFVAVESDEFVLIANKHSIIAVQIYI